jgi:hypothetical protein
MVSTRTATPLNRTGTPTPRRIRLFLSERCARCGRGCGGRNASSVWRLLCCGVQQDLCRCALARRRVGGFRDRHVRRRRQLAPWFIPQDDRSVINLEHVLPKKPETNWPSFSKEDVALYATRLGNLCLLRAPDNSTMKSDAFDDKKPVYKRSPYILTSEIDTYSVWNVESITQRQQGLARFAVRAWPLAKPGAQPQRPAGDSK